MKHWLMVLILGFYGLRILQAIGCGCLDFNGTILYGCDWVGLFVLGSWRLNRTSTAVLQQMRGLL